MWYPISGLILLVSAVALLVRGLNFSVEFKGGSVFQFPAAGRAAAPGDISRVVTSAGGGDSTVQHVSPARCTQWQVTTGALRTTSAERPDALEKAFHVAAEQDDVQFVGPTWGSQITPRRSRR